MKSKLENGEVNLEKELQKLSKHWIGDIMCDQWIEQVEELFTNALNQQRVKLITEIKEKYPDFIYQEWVEVATPHNFEAGKINETAFDEFLTKLEEKK